MARALQGEALRHDLSQPGLRAQKKMDRAEEAVALECASHACALFRRSHASARRRLYARSWGHGLGPGLAPAPCPQFRAGWAESSGGRRARRARRTREAWLPASEGGSMAPAVQGEALRHDLSQPPGKSHPGRQFNSLQKTNLRPSEVPFFDSKPAKRYLLCLWIGQTRVMGWKPMPPPFGIIGHSLEHPKIPDAQTALRMAHIPKGFDTALACLRRLLPQMPLDGLQDGDTATGADLPQRVGGLRGKDDIVSHQSKG